MCDIPGCDRSDIKGRGLCGRHYQWARITGRLDSFSRKIRPVAGRMCEAEGCDQPVKASGGRYCSPHSHRYYKASPPPVRPCAVEGCERNRHAGGKWCSMHSERMRRTGNLGPVGSRKTDNRGKSCRVEGCERPAYAYGHCTMHHARIQTKGEPGPAAPLYAPRGNGCIELGYRRYAVGNGKRESEHRLVWIEANGPIPDGMVIHHINGDKLDNRLENLQMMTRSDHCNLHREDQQAGRHGWDLP